MSPSKAVRSVVPAGLAAPFFTLGMRLAVLLTVLLHPLFFLTYILPAWIIFMLTRYIFVVLRAPDKVPGLFTYMIFYEVFLYWMNLYALFTVRNKSWITRQPASVDIAGSPSPSKLTYSFPCFAPTVRLPHRDEGEARSRGKSDFLRASF